MSAVFLSFVAFFIENINMKTSFISFAKSKEIRRCLTQENKHLHHITTAIALFLFNHLFQNTNEPSKLISRPHGFG